MPSMKGAHLIRDLAKKVPEPFEGCNPWLELLVTTHDVTQHVDDRLHVQQKRSAADANTIPCIKL